MVRRGLTVYTAGNISVRTQDGKGFYIKPSSVRYSDIRPQDLVTVDWEGNPISGTRPPSIEHNLHRLIYLARPDAIAIAHTHSTYATTLSASNMRCGIPATLGESARSSGSKAPRRSTAGKEQIRGPRSTRGSSSTSPLLAVSPLPRSSRTPPLPWRKLWTRSPAVLASSRRSPASRLSSSRPRYRWRLFSNPTNIPMS